LWHSLSPEALNSPPTHGTQLSSEPLPDAGLNVPGVQCVHTDAALPLKEPGTHGTHVSTDELPSAALNEPGSHF
jgi:hypothetical protein